MKMTFAQMQKGKTMRLIDADKLHEIINFTAFKPPFSKKAIHRYIDDTPTVGAVPIIRCYECKHFRTDLSDPNESPWCYEGIQDPDFHEFCSRAERKENGTHD